MLSIAGILLVQAAYSIEIKRHKAKIGVLIYLYVSKFITQLHHLDDKRYYIQYITLNFFKQTCIDELDHLRLRYHLLLFCLRAW